MPQLSLASSKLHLFQVEKEEVISQLKEANSEISILKAKNMALERIDFKSKGEKQFKFCHWNVDYVLIGATESILPRQHFNVHLGVYCNICVCNVPSIIALYTDRCNTADSLDY